MLIRIITALVLAPLALGAIYGLDARAFAWTMAAIVGWAAWEWAGLVFAHGPVDSAETETEVSVANNPSATLIVGALFVSSCVALCAWLWTRPGLLRDWLMITALCWLWAIVEVLIYPKQTSVRRNFRWVVFGLIVLPGAWAAMVLLKALDPHLLVMACVLVWGADAGAYFVGRALGKRKLAPRVSPGKTWEGAIGGALVGVFVALGFGVALVPAVAAAPLGYFLAALLLVMVSVFGDLFESILKRTAGAKDSGKLLPGHGGILDRIDALIAVLPLMVIVTGWLT